MSEIRIYLEGGGDGDLTKNPLRKGFHAFLKEVIDSARSRRIRFQIVACGTRNDAYRNFVTALQKHPHAFNVLLVDSEEIVQGGVWEHLQRRDHWSRTDASDDHCLLMVQIMESWFLADPDALQRVYGDGFAPSALPGNANVEKIAKNTILRSLKAATKNTQKRQYHKTRHAPQILETLSANLVRQAAPHCDRLFATLHAEIARDLAAPQ